MLAERICMLRRKNGLSQEQLAEKLGVSRQSVSKWESGASTPELEKLLALSDCFGMTLDELVREQPAGAETDEERPQAAPTNDAARTKAGIGLCLAGAVCLLLTGIVTLLRPAAAERLDVSSMVTISGSGILMIFCVLVMLAGLGLLRKK